MMMRRGKGFLAVMVATAALSGCFGAKSDPSRFYVLSSMLDRGNEFPTEMSDIRLGLGPMEFPAHLDRSELVTRVGANEVRFSDYERWASSIGEDFTATLAANLGVLLKTDRIYVYPWGSRARVDYSVTMFVLRFERDADGGAELHAIWSVLDGETNQQLYRVESRITETSGGAGDTSASVAALSRALDQLAREVSERILADQSRSGASR